MVAHQHWRIYVTEGNAALLCDVGTLEMRATAGGATQCTGGTPSASTAATGSFGPVAGAFDASTSTSWQTTSGSPVGAWLRYSFAAPVTVTQVAITGSSVYYASCPKAVDVQWSDDGSSWTTAFSGSGMTNWSAGSTTLITEGGPVPARVTAQSLEVLSASAANIRVTAQSLEVLVATYEVRVMKGVGYAVLTSAGDRIGLQKAVGYAVLNSSAVVSISKATAYAVLFDTTVSTSDRRKPVIAFCS